MKLSQPGIQLPTRPPNHPWPMVIIGSGYGASVMAARLAPRFPSGELLVLERGREFAPSEFPRNGVDLLNELKSTRRPQGLFDFRATRDLDVLVGNGLGGTSLINAAVMLEAESLEKVDPDYPQDVAFGALQEYYDRARSVLAPETALDREDPIADPLAFDGFQRPQRFRDPLSKAAVFKGLDSKKVPLAIHLTERSGKSGTPLCVQCGDCVTGCPVGAKKSVDRNYLKLAHQSGASIFTDVEVLGIEPVLGADVHYRLHVRVHSEKGSLTSVIHAKRVVIGAGSVGSTQLLLRSRKTYGLSTSKTLGTRFSGNADSFALGLSQETKPKPSSPQTSDPEERPGPTIVHWVDQRAEKGSILQDGSIPSALHSILQRLFGKFSREKSVVFLGMGYDSSQARWTLNDRDEFELSWESSGRDRSLSSQEKDFADLSKTLGLKLVESPRARAGVPVTVHPLGGVPMGTSVDQGCVDSAGRLWNEAGAVHPGLYVVDGSICRGSVGSNPALTIAALAEHAAERILTEDLEQ